MAPLPVTSTCQSAHLLRQAAEHAQLVHVAHDPFQLHRIEAGSS